MALHLKKFESQRMLCAKFGSNWPSGSGDDKSERVYNNDRQQTIFDQKSLLELLAQVS